jgi:hypothetical protein
MSASSENFDPSKMSLKDRIKFFASKAKENAVAAGGKAAVSPTRAALLEGSAVGRARSFASSMVVEGGTGASRLGVRATAPAPAAAAPADAELAEAIIAAPRAPAPEAAPAPAAAEEAPPAAPAHAPVPVPPPRVAVVLPPALGGGARALGLRLARAGPRDAVVVAGVDPQGAAAGGGVAVGCVLVALRVGVAQLWGEGDSCEEGALQARLGEALAAGARFAGERLEAEFVKAGTC